MATATMATEQIQQIKNRLKAVNGRRRERILTLSDVDRVVESVMDGCEWKYCHGGSVANAYKYPAKTTVVFAARVDGHVYVGIGTSPATAPTPGRAWKCLQPFGKGDVKAKLRQWVAECNPIRID